MARTRRRKVGKEDCCELPVEEERSFPKREKECSQTGTCLLGHPLEVQKLKTETMHKHERKYKHKEHEHK